MDSEHIWIEAYIVNVYIDINLLSRHDFNGQPMLASTSQPPGMMSYAADTLQRFALCLRLCDLNFVVSLEFFSFLSFLLFCYVFELRFATPFAVSGPIDLLALLFAIRMSWLQSCLSGLSGLELDRERSLAVSTARIQVQPSCLVTQVELPMLCTISQLKFIR